MTTTPSPEQVFEQALEIAQLGEYVSGDSYALTIYLPNNIMIVASIAVDSDVEITQGNITVFKATESYLGDFTVDCFELGDWTSDLNKAYQEIARR